MFSCRRENGAKCIRFLRCGLSKLRNRINIRSVLLANAFFHLAGVPVRLLFRLQNVIFGQALHPTLFCKLCLYPSRFYTKNDKKIVPILLFLQKMDGFVKKHCETFTPFTNIYLYLQRKLLIDEQDELFL